MLIVLTDPHKTWNDTEIKVNRPLHDNDEL